MIKAEDFQKGLELIDQAGSVLITTHIKPDGDACGSVAALAEVLRDIGKQVKVLLPGPMPEWYELDFGEEAAVLGEDVTIEQLKKGEFGEFDLIIIVDTNSKAQISKFEEYLKQAGKPVLVLDHHVTGDSLGDVELIDPTAAATALIVYELFKYTNRPITASIAQALFTGIATDTGWFQFSNTDSRVYSVAAELVEAGAEPGKLYRSLYRNFSAGRFRLMLAMLNTLELHLGGRYAAQQILQADFERTGTTPKDTEDLINECQRMGTVEVAALFTEAEAGKFKCSLRSRGNVDVRRIAEKFGGGGHIRAAGTEVPGPLENAKQLILAEVTEQIKRADNR